MAEPSKSVFYVRQENIADFVARMTPLLLEDGWVCTTPAASITDPVWAPPWDPARRLAIHEAVNEGSQRYMTAWLLAGQPEDGDAFYAAWRVRGFPCPM
jgi:hypothetical protein